MARPGSTSRIWSSCVRPDATRHLRVRPRPRVREVGQLGDRRHVDADHGQRARRFLRLVVLPIGEHDQRKPWPQPCRRSPRRREQPGEVGVVELDPGQVVRLEARRRVPGLGADDVPGIDADHVDRAVSSTSFASPCRSASARRRSSPRALHVEFGPVGNGLRRVVGP